MNENLTMASLTSRAKGSLRIKMKECLKLMNTKCKKDQSGSIFKKLVELQCYKDSKQIGVYLSMDEEVQTYPIIENIFLTGKQCFIPWYNKDIMKMVKLESMDDLNSLPKTKWNIKQPKDISGREDSFKGGLDLVLVPGLAFTLEGKRLGRGKGYYDRFLKEMNELTVNNDKPMTTVGLAFKEQVIKDIPCDPHDFIVDQVIFPDMNEIR